MERLCEYCQKTFEPKRTDTKFCSHSCRQMDYLNRRVNSFVNLNGTNEGETSIDIFPENEKASTDGSLPVKPSIDTYDKSVKNDPEPSIFISKDVKSSIDVSEISVNFGEKKTSIDVLNSQNNHQSGQNTSEYMPYHSVFLNDLADLSDDDSYKCQISLLLFEKVSSLEVSWVSLRLRCLIECLLTFSEMKFVQLDSLKEACNAFTLVIKSKFYQLLPKSYPYTFLTLRLREDLKRLCLENEECSEIRFRLRTKYKKELIISRWELAYFFPKKTFGELEFKV